MYCGNHWADLGQNDCFVDLVSVVLNWCQVETPLIPMFSTPFLEPTTGDMVSSNLL